MRKLDFESNELEKRLQASPIKKMGACILNTMSSGSDKQNLQSIVSLQISTEVKAANTLQAMIDSSEIDVEEKFYNTTRCTFINEKNATNGTVVYVHGGGFLSGILSSQWKWLSHLIKATGMAAIVIHYNHYPASKSYAEMVEECLEAIIQITEETLLSQHWYIAGDSAGASLVLSMLSELSNIDATKFMPNGALLISPWVEASTRGSFEKPVDPLLDERWLNWISEQIELQSATVDWSLVSRSRLKVMLQVGTAELFLPGARELKKSLDKLGIENVYHEEEGGVHAYPLFLGSEASKRAIEQQSQWLFSFKN